MWRRDGGCCTAVLASGERCGSTRRLALDHVVPLARGGASTVETFARKGHNLAEARRILGDALMDAYAPRARGGSA